jgi:hypothetical protein
MGDFLEMQRVNETTWRFHVTDRLITPGKLLFDDNTNRVATLAPTE